MTAESAHYQQDVLFDNTPSEPRSFVSISYQGQKISQDIWINDALRAFQEHISKRDNNSPIEWYINYLRNYEYRMAKDMKESGVLYSREAIAFFLWAWENSSLDARSKSRMKTGSYFGSSLAYYAYYADFAQNEEELIELCKRPMYPWDHPFCRNPKKVASPDEIEDGVELAFIHGRFVGSIPHAGHIDSINRLIKLKKKNPKVRVMVGVDSAFNIDQEGINNWLVSPLFACSAIAQLPGVDYVYELKGPYNQKFQDLYIKPLEDLHYVNYQDLSDEWDHYYRELYQQFNIKYLHVRTGKGNSHWQDQANRAEDLGITPVYVHRSRFALSDSILRGLKRGYEWSPYPPHRVYTDFTEQAQDMDLEIRFKYIPQLLAKKAAQRR